MSVPLMSMTSDYMVSHYLREAHKDKFCDADGQRFGSACNVLDHVCFGTDTFDITYCDGEYNSKGLIH